VLVDEVGEITSAVRVFVVVDVVCVVCEVCFVIGVVVAIVFVVEVVCAMLCVEFCMFDVKIFIAFAVIEKKTGFDRYK